MGVDLDFGAQVTTAEGPVIGLLSGVVVRPGGWTVTHLVVRYGLIVAVERVVPLAAVGAVHDHRVELGLTVHELGEMPELEEHAYVPLTGIDTGSEERPALSVPGLWTRTPAIALQYLVADNTTDQANVVEEWRSVPEGSLVLREGLAVRAQDGKRMGSLKELMLDLATGGLTALAITRGAHIKAVPAAWIERGDEKTGIVLAVDRRAVAELPDYRE